MHCEDFPGIAIRIRKPELILTSKATGSVLLDPLQDALCLKTFLPGGNFFYRLDFDPQVVNRTQPSGRRYQSSRPVASNRILRNPASASEVPRQIPFDKTPPMPGHCASETCGLMAVSFMVE